MRSGRELLGIDDPLDAEDWASVVLGTSYKPPIPPREQDRLTPLILDGVLAAADRQADAVAVCVLRALAAVGPTSHAGLLDVMADGILPTTTRPAASSSTVSRPAATSATVIRCAGAPSWSRCSCWTSCPAR
jgi:hypothetical protein